MPIHRPDIQFILISTDPAKIKFFGSLMSSLLLLKDSLLRFIHYQVIKGYTPQMDVGTNIHNESIV